MVAAVSADKKKTCMYKGVAYIVATDLRRNKEFIDVNGKRMYLDKNGSVAARQCGGENCKTALDNFEDMKKVYNHFMETKDWHYYLLFMLNMHTARRIGDILFTKWEDFYDKDGNLKEYWYVMRDDDGYRVAGEEKTEKKAKVFLNQSVRDAFSLYLQRTGIDPVKCANKYVFAQRRGRYQGQVLSQKAYWKRLQKLEDVLGYKITSHTMRRGEVSTIISSNPSDQKVRPTMGGYLNHSNEQTTSRYIGEVEKLTKKYLSEFGDMFQKYAVNGEEIPFNLKHPVSVYNNFELRDYMLDAFKKIHENAQETDPFKMMELYNTLLDGLESIAKN